MNVRSLALAAVIAGAASAALAQSAVSAGEGEPTALTAPHTPDELRCAPTSPPPTSPQQIDAARLNAFRRSLAVDPAGLCRYRDANRALPAAGPDRVVFIGDSITEGWAASAPDLFAGDVLDRGISGQNTSQMLLRFEADVVDLHPRVVHIMGGINDINTPAGTALTRSNLRAMVELAQAHGITVVLGSITPSSRFWTAPELQPGPQIAMLNAWIKAFAAERGLAFVDYYTPMQDGRFGMRADLTNEGLHPNPRGYAVMTPIAKAAVARALAGPRPR